MRRPHNIVWTQEQDAVIRANWPLASMSIPMIAARIGVEDPRHVDYRGRDCLKLGPKPRGGFDWTTERDARLTLLWSDPAMGTKAIAEDIGPGVISKNAVISQARKLQLPARKVSPGPRGGAGAVRKAKTPRPPQRPKEARSFKPLIVGRGAVMEAAESPPPKVGFKARAFRPLPQSHPVRFIDSEPHHCKWPVGGPDGADMLICACRRAGEGPYCAAHAAAARGKGTESERNAHRPLRRAA